MIYKKLRQYVPEKMAFAFIGIILSFAAAVLSILSYKYIYEFFTKIIVENDMEGALPLAWKIVLFLVISAVVYFLSVFSTHILAFRLETNLKKEAVKRLMSASFSFYDSNQSGKIRKELDDNTVLTHTAVAHLIPDLSSAVFVPLLGVVLAFTIDYRLGILMLITIFSGVLMMKLMMGDKAFMDKYMEASNKMNAGAVEYVRGINVLKIFKSNIKELKDFYKSITDYSDLALKYSMSCRRWYVIFQVIFNSIFLLALIIPLMDAGEPMVALTKVMFYALFNGVIIVAFMKVMYVGMYVFYADSCIGKIEKIFEDMEAYKMESGSVNKIDNNSIEFKNVSFGYGESLVIDDLSFKLDEGKKYALVGSSGSGKSTIAKLISGFYKLNAGKIYIGSHSLEEYKEEIIASSIANVFQDAKLFKASIYENVKIGNPRAGYEEIMEAMHLAQCDDILEKFEDRENTIIGSKGVHLSGGEVQRLTIARAIIKNAGIIIMDEASAAADPENEYELQKALFNLMKGKTVIMIAHRLSSIKNVDEILVIDSGKILERGSHKELMSKESHYKALQGKYVEANEWRVR